MVCVSVCLCACVNVCGSVGLTLRCYVCLIASLCVDAAHHHVSCLCVFHCTWVCCMRMCVRVCSIVPLCTICVCVCVCSIVPMCTVCVCAPLYRCVLIACVSACVWPQACDLCGFPTVLGKSTPPRAKVSAGTPPTRYTVRTDARQRQSTTAMEEHSRDPVPTLDSDGAGNRRRGRRDSGGSTDVAAPLPPGSSSTATGWQVSGSYTDARMERAVSAGPPATVASAAQHGPRPVTGRDPAAPPLADPGRTTWEAQPGLLGHSRSAPVLQRRSKRRAPGPIPPEGHAHRTSPTVSSPLSPAQSADPGGMRGGALGSVCAVAVDQLCASHCRKHKVSS